MSTSPSNEQPDPERDLNEAMRAWNDRDPEALAAAQSRVAAMLPSSQPFAIDPADAAGKTSRFAEWNTGLSADLRTALAFEETTWDHLMVVFDRWGAALEDISHPPTKTTAIIVISPSGERLCAGSDLDVTPESLEDIMSERHGHDRPFPTARFYAERRTPAQSVDPKTQSEIDRDVSEMLRGNPKAVPLTAAIAENADALDAWHIDVGDALQQAIARPDVTWNHLTNILNRWGVTIAERLEPTTGRAETVLVNPTGVELPGSSLTVSLDTLEDTLSQRSGAPLPFPGSRYFERRQAQRRGEQTQTRAVDDAEEHLARELLGSPPPRNGPTLEGFDPLEIVGSLTAPPHPNAGTINAGAQPSAASASSGTVPNTATTVENASPWGDRRTALREKLEAQKHGEDVRWLLWAREAAVIDLEEFPKLIASGADVATAPEPGYRDPMTAPELHRVKRLMTGIDAFATPQGYAVFVGTSAVPGFFADSDAYRFTRLTDAKSESLAVALQLSAERWGTVTLNGNKAFVDRALRTAAELGITVSNPELQERYAREVEAIHTRLATRAPIRASQNTWATAIVGNIDLPSVDSRTETTTPSGTLIAHRLTNEATGESRRARTDQRAELLIRNAKGQHFIVHADPSVVTPTFLRTLQQEYEISLAVSTPANGARPTVVLEQAYPEEAARRSSWRKENLDAILSYEQRTKNVDLAKARFAIQRAGERLEMLRPEKDAQPQRRQTRQQQAEHEAEPDLEFAI